MRVVDHVIFIVYFLLMLGVGVFFYRKNRNIEDYYVGGRFIANTSSLLFHNCSCISMMAERP